MRAGMLLGILAVIVGVTASTFALLTVVAPYAIPGSPSLHTLYTPRLPFGVLAFVLALVIGIGASLLRARPDVGAVLMIVASIGGTLALSAFDASPAFVYAISVPLCLLGAFLAVRQAAPTPTVVALRWLTLLLLAAGVAAGYRFGGFVGAIALAVPFLIAAGLVLADRTSNGQA